jgi:hypothetical protein
MPRFLCSNCHEVSEMAGVGRFDWCAACGEPLTAEDRLPVHFGISTSAPAEVAAPALATTTNPIAASSRAPRISPSTT